MLLLFLGWLVVCLVWLIPAGEYFICLVLAMLAFGLAMGGVVFSPALDPPRIIADAERRALALAGAQQAVWDWDSETGELFTGAELEKNLGLTAGALSEGGLEAFLARMHPADRPTYKAAVDAALHRGCGPFSVQFRLRRIDGGYRWMLLRA